MQLKAQAIVALGAAAIGAVAAGAPAAAADGLASSPAHVLESFTRPSAFDFGSLVSVLDNSAVTALPVQLCGSQVGAGIVAQDSYSSPNVVGGGCDNATTVIGGHHRHDPCDDDCPADCPACASRYAGARPTAEAGAATLIHPPAAYHPRHGRDSLVSVGSGSAITALPVQLCGSQVGAGVIAQRTAYSPNVVEGGCDNATTYLGRDRGRHGGGSLVSILDNSSLSVAPVQMCGSQAVLGVGLLDSFASPNAVGGGCRNATTVIK